MGKGLIFGWIVLSLPVGNPAAVLILATSGGGRRIGGLKEA